MSAESIHAAGQRAAESAAGAAKPIMTPVERLELSRAQMRVFLDRKKKPVGEASGLNTGNVGAKVSDWADGLRANPLMGAVVDAVHNWWMSHPLRAVTLMAGDAVEDIAVPWIRRYPLGVVGGALALGIVASKIRPWRWLGRPALFAGLTSQIASQLMTHAPLEFLIDTFKDFAKPKARPASAAGVAPTSGVVADDLAGIDDLGSVGSPVPAATASRSATSEPVATF